MASREVTSLTTADVITRVEVKLSFRRNIKGKDGNFIRTYISCASREAAVALAREISISQKVDVDGDPSRTGAIPFKAHANGTMTWGEPKL